MSSRSHNMTGSESLGSSSSLTQRTLNGLDFESAKLSFSTNEVYGIQDADIAQFEQIKSRKAINSLSAVAKNPKKVLQACGLAALALTAGSYFSSTSDNSNGEFSLESESSGSFSGLRMPMPNINRETAGEEYEARLSSTESKQNHLELWNKVKSSLERRADSVGFTEGSNPDVFLVLGQELKQDWAETYMQTLADLVMNKIQDMVYEFEHSPTATQNEVLLILSGGQTGNVAEYDSERGFYKIEVEEKDLAEFEGKSEGDFNRFLCVDGESEDSCAQVVGTSGDKFIVKVPFADFRAESLVMREQSVKSLISQGFTFSKTVKIDYSHCAVRQREFERRGVNDACENVLNYHVFEKFVNRRGTNGEVTIETFKVSVWGGITSKADVQFQTEKLDGLRAGPVSLNPWLDLGANTTEENAMEGVLATDNWNRRVKENSLEMPKIGATTYVAGQGWRGIVALETQRTPEMGLVGEAEMELMRNIQPKIHERNPFHPNTAGTGFDKDLLAVARHNMTDARSGVKDFETNNKRILDAEFITTMRANYALENASQFQKFARASLKEQSRLMLGEEYVRHSLFSPCVFREMKFEVPQFTVNSAAARRGLCNEEIVDLLEGVAKKNETEPSMRDMGGWIALFDTKERVHALVENSPKNRAAGGSSLASKKTFGGIVKDNIRRGRKEKELRLKAIAEKKNFERNGAVKVETLFIGTVAAHSVECPQDAGDDVSNCARFVEQQSFSHVYVGKV